MQVFYMGLFMTDNEFGNRLIPMVGLNENVVEKRKCSLALYGIEPQVTALFIKFICC